MSEWLSNSLGELVTFQKGRKVATSPYPLENYAAYLGASRLSGASEGYGSKFLAVTADEHDVLMLWDGERSGLCRTGLSGVVSSTVAKLTPSDSINSFLLYYLLLYNFQWIQNRRTGTGVPHVPKDLGKILLLTYPKSKYEQQKIACILQAIDQAIEKTEVLIDKYQQIKAGLMHDLFTRGVGPDGKLRSPREQAPELYQETPIGWIPKEWKISAISSVLESVVDGPFGSNLKTEHYVEDPGVRVVRLQNVLKYEYNDSDRAYVSDRHAGTLVRNKVIGEDVLIAGLGDDKFPVGRSCMYPNDLPAAINKADCFRARCISSIAMNKFFMLFLNSMLARGQVRRYEQGVTRPRINTGNLKQLKIALPSIKEQAAICSKFNRIQDLVEIEKRRLAKLQKQKTGLMHDLLTGEVPVQVEPEAKPETINA
ncbi:restriction endonuclease subunit S [Vreelandella maris]|uniref:Restriction endonuclease subunit S n=1 Tax=Vreelandella maris TaxID=2729617 RepID=A0A7Y6RAN1_9GAMM|nr:restriction endonuclease subunit S [Halomonas maris]NVF13472.1 restriction endonuclease subunit S [Halomonas maris]|tara:strand:+ start:3043 stop:4320 length:1278 start_codon:yes stop_codon:yes gene_type:complete